MNGSHIVVKYFSRRMLLTVDLNTLFLTLFDAYCDDVGIEFAEMDEREKAESTEVVEGLRSVRERFHVLEVGGPPDVRRRKDLEQAAVALGQK